MGWGEVRSGEDNARCGMCAVSVACTRSCGLGKCILRPRWPCWLAAQRSACSVLAALSLQQAALRPSRHPCRATLQHIPQYTRRVHSLAMQSSQSCQASKLIPSSKDHPMLCCAPQAIMRAFRQAAQLAVARVRELAIDIGGGDLAHRKELLRNCAMTSLNSKLVGVSVWVGGWGGVGPLGRPPSTPIWWVRLCGCGCGVTSLNSNAGGRGRGRIWAAGRVPGEGGILCVSGQDAGQPAGDNAAAGHAASATSRGPNPTLPRP